MDNPKPQQNNTEPVTSPSPQKPNANKKIILLILMLVILAGVVYYLANKSSTSNSNNTAQQSQAAPQLKESAAVSITGSGFTPATIEVKVGTQVTWTNSDKLPHQVAADPHPLHNSIPGFDSDKVLNTNDSYTFTFEKAGTYHYHDHLNPLTLNGTVVVK